MTAWEKVLAARAEEAVGTDSRKVGEQTALAKNVHRESPEFVLDRIAVDALPTVPDLFRKETPGFR